MDDGTYVSSSSIDSPPREPKATKDGQTIIPGMEMEVADASKDADKAKEELNGDAYFRRFKTVLQLKLQVGEKAYNITLLKGEYESNRIIELIEDAVKGRYNRGLVEAVLDIPKTKQTDDAQESGGISQGAAVSTLAEVGKALNDKKDEKSTEATTNDDKPVKSSKKKKKDEKKEEKPLVDDDNF